MSADMIFLPCFHSFGCSVFCLDCPLGHISVSMYLSCYSIVFCFSHSLFSSVYSWGGISRVVFLLCRHCFSVLYLALLLVFVFSLSSCLSAIVRLSAHYRSAAPLHLPICCFWTKSKEVIVVPQQQELQCLTSVCLLRDSELDPSLSPGE